MALVSNATFVVFLKKLPFNDQDRDTYLLRTGTMLKQAVNTKASVRARKRAQYQRTALLVKAQQRGGEGKRPYSSDAAELARKLGYAALMVDLSIKTAAQSK